MKRGGGPEKGHSYERKVCRSLTKWITGVDTPLLFWRSTTSGAHFTTTRGAKSQAGDITCVSTPGELGYEEALWLSSIFTIECKNTKPENMYIGHTAGFEKLWSQAVRQARGLNKEPILFCHFNYCKEFVGFSTTVGQIIEKRVKKYVTYSFGIALEPVTLFLLQGVLLLQFQEFSQLIKDLKKIG